MTAAAGHSCNSVVCHLGALGALGALAVQSFSSRASPVHFPNARILIMAKAPEAGRVKTRLMPVLDAQAAADLHARLLEGVVARLSAAGLAAVELWCAPDPGADLFQRLARGYGVSLHRQSDGDLGERMGSAARDALTRSAAVVLVGADCPLLDGGYAAAALTALDGHDAVLGPAEDGGYVLLGLHRAPRELFDDMPWGGDRVARMTRMRMCGLGWDWCELSALWDVDRPEDLTRYQALRGAGE